MSYKVTQGKAPARIKLNGYLVGLKFKLKGCSVLNENKVNDGQMDRGAEKL